MVLLDYKNSLEEFQEPQSKLRKGSYLLTDLGITELDIKPITELGYVKQ